MAQNGARMIQISVVLDSGIFLTDAVRAHEDDCDVGYFMPQFVIYGDSNEIHTSDLVGMHSSSRIVEVRHLDAGKNEVSDGVEYRQDLLKYLLRRNELYNGPDPVVITSRFDWIFRFKSGQFRASNVKERIFKLFDGYTNQPNGKRQVVRPIAHDVVVHYDIAPDDEFDLSIDGKPIWSSADHARVQKRFDIEIIAPHGTAENYFRDALNHKGQDYWVPNQGDPDPMAGRP